MMKTQPTSLSVRIRRAWLIGSGLSLSTVALPLLAANDSPAVQALFDQANYWHQKAHDNLAREALQKVLMVDANNAQAMYLMALWAQQNGDTAGMTQWRARLSQVSPQDPRLTELDRARQQQAIPQGQLALARRQARSGNTAAALQTWRAIFNGSEPPASIAVEYYLTMAGDRQQLPQAIEQLRQFSASNPQDRAAALALARALTYQESTRREGLQTLQAMAASDKEADTALRQALLWLAPAESDAPLYENYQQRHPQDTPVLAHFRSSVGGEARSQGYSELNQGDVSGAQSAFNQVLKTNPDDADALAGLGYVAQRSGNYTQAADYLERSAKLGGNNSQQRQQQAEDARFYGQLATAQQALTAGNTAQALALSEPLTQAGGERGVAAQLFRADALRRSNQPEQAERAFRSVLAGDANNEAAKEGLFYVLRQQNRTAEANALLASLPNSVRAAVAPRPFASGDPLRAEAKRALAAGDVQRAIAILQQGTQRFPSDGWLRLDLARIYQQQGNTAAAADVMQPAFRNGATSNEVYSAALFASENGAWEQAWALLSRIPARSQNGDMRALAQRVRFNQQMRTAQQSLAQGAIPAAASTLQALAATPPSSPADAGNLARALAQAGDLTTAVAVVRGNMRRGVQGNAGDYAAQAAVLEQAGLGSEAQRFLNSPEILARSTPAQLASLRNGSVIDEADRLREQKQYAAAYDKLIGALQKDPQNSDLMFAMARLYQSGKMNKEAGVVYSYLMTRDTPDQQAREGAVNVALALNDVPRARALSQQLHGQPSVDRLLLLARVAEADGNRSEALGYLRTARGKAIGLTHADSSGGADIGGLSMSSNPFINRTTLVARPSASTYGQTMPWQQSSDYRATPLATTFSMGNTPQPQQNQTLARIDTMMADLEKDTGTWLQAGVQIRSRDGETGLSKLTEAKAPLTWSSSPLGDARFDFTVTPVNLTSGSASGDAYRRLGSGASEQAIGNLLATIKSEQTYISSLSSTELATFNSTNPGVASGLAALDGITFDELNPLTATGLKNITSLNNNTALKNYLVASSRKPSLDSTSSSSSDSQNASGVELNLALTGNSYKIDLGSTPLGQDLSTVVGGIKWAPKLTDYLTLIVTGERRAVTDSLLSYVGIKDKLSGTSWGRVTKNGGNLMLSYDDGDAGFYAGGGAYSYLGENVASNNSLLANAGAYVRPFHYDDRELKTGISLSWMDFKKNLSYYSYGQGGYFSPQNFVSVAFPVDYSQSYDDLNVKIGGSIGYQSYTQDRSAYYPNKPAWQSLLETAVSAGFAKEAYYTGGSQSGIGYNLHAGADYKINKNITVGGQLGYDTFGQYNESTAQLYFRYMLGGEP